MPHRALTHLGLPLATLAMAMTGCDDGPREGDGGRSGARTAAPEPTASPWLQTGTGHAVAADDADVTLAEGLATATAEARATAERARTAWMAASPTDRATWAIKWAAPTEAGGTEHVWVVPVSWSPFRIEGRLVSTPQTRLACEAGEGDIVGFPIEELSDWVRRLSTGDREGGFTIEVLEGVYGEPGR